MTVTYTKILEKVMTFQKLPKTHFGYTFLKFQEKHITMAMILLIPLPPDCFRSGKLKI